MTGNDYKFVRIEDAMACINQKVNLIGVVAGTSIPKRTRGTDYFVSVKIIDESRTTGIYVHFFAETMAGLPQVEYVGDILLVSQVVVKKWEPEPFAEFNKKFSSFALFRGRESTMKGLVTYQTSPRYNPTNHDISIMKFLKWSIENNISDLNASSSLEDIKELEETESLNMLCKILYISNVGNETMLFVWDGTDTPPAPLEAKLEDEMQSPLPLQLEPSLSKNTLCTFPTVGTVLRMSVDQGDDKLGLHYLKPDRWVKLTNLKCEVREALWVAVLMPHSKICYLHDDDDAVTARLRSYDERLLGKWRRMPLLCFPGPSYITETCEPNVTFVTLMDALTHHEVVAIIPWRAEDFRCPRGIYRVRVTLEDPTARIHAFIYADEGENFFGDSHSVDILTKKRNLLLGVATEDGDPQAENVTRNPPWIQCCLRSYCNDDSDVWGTRRFQIYGTRCLG